MKLHQLLTTEHFDRPAIYEEYCRLLDPADTGMIVLTTELQRAIDTILDELIAATPDPSASEERLLVVDNPIDWTLSEIVIEPKNLTHTFIASTPVEALVAMEVEIPSSSDTTDHTFVSFLVADLMLYGLTYDDRAKATQEILSRVKDITRDPDSFVSFEEVERQLKLN